MTIRIVDSLGHHEDIVLHNRSFAPNIGDHLFVQSMEFIVENKVCIYDEKAERDTVRVYVKPAFRELNQQLIRR